MTSVSPSARQSLFVGVSETVQRARRPAQRVDAPTRQRRSRRFVAVVVAISLVVAGLAIVLGRSNPGGVLDVLSGHTWLASTDTGTVSLTNDATGSVDFNLKVPSAAGQDFTVSQNGSSAILINRSDGTVGAIDLSEYKVIGSAKAGAGNAVDVVPDGSKVFVVKRNSGIVERRDGLTNAKLAQTRVGKRLTRGVVDADGNLWVIDTPSATLFEVRVQKKRLVAVAVAELGGASRSLELTLVAGQPVVLDLANGALVRVIDGEAQPVVKLPVTSAENPVIARTVTGDVIPIALNDSGKLVLVGADDSTTIVPLPDRGGHKFGEPISFAGRIYVPDFASGEVVSMTPEGGLLPGLISVRDGAGPFDVFVNNGSLFINDPKSQATDAWVVGKDGRPHRVDKNRGDIPTNEEIPPPADLPAPSATPPPPVVQVPRDEEQVGPPSAPTGVTASAAPGQISVLWGASQENGSPVTGYRVSWTSAGGGGSQDVGAGTTSLTVNTGIVNGETYTFGVVALSDAGPSAAASSGPITPAGAPIVNGLSAQLVGDRTVRVSASVSDNGGGGSTCHVYFNGAERATVGCSGGFSVDVGGLGYSTNYDVYAVADNSVGTGPESNHAGVGTNAPPPPPPSVSISKGASASVPTCPSNCFRINVNISNFPAGNHGVTCSDSDGAFFSYTMSADGAGNGSSAVCIYGFPGRTVTVTVSGTSASMPWP